VDEALGEAVLTLAVEAAQRAWGSRLRAAYALGSLAHGGFSSLVSDVDLGLLLEDPLAPADAQRVKDVNEQVKASSLPLADRLSIFWGSQASLRGDGGEGRFPSLDRLDLIRHGRLIAGQDTRAGLPVPSQRQLVVEAAQFCAGLVPRSRIEEWVQNPAGLVASGPRPLTKAVLFPVRFLYTAETGEIGRNHDAASYIARQYRGPIGDLAAAALTWREQPPGPEDNAAVRLVADGLGPLYITCLEDHEARMLGYGETELAERLSEVRSTLGASE